MSAALGTYHFLSWARRGVGSALSNKDGGGSLPSRGSLSVQLALDVQQGTSDTPVNPAPTTVQIYGPGDVTQVDPRYVIRTEPRDGTPNFEPNYLCGIEFDGPDFPWLFTPAAPNGDRLRPWVALIVLKKDEYGEPSVAPNPLPVIEVSSIAALSDLSDSWNWAHVQVSGDKALAEAMGSAPGTVSSRLLCPRRLDPETSYRAFLVPAFEIGRQVGVGQDVSAVANADPAWTSHTAVPLRLPYYYAFEFHTSDEGDFESLVRKLAPRVLPPTVGKRPMDVSQPMASFPSAGAPLGLEGALYSVGTISDPWSGTDKDNFQTALQGFVNLNTPTTDDPAHPNPQDPQVVPPLYGQWHAAIASVNKDTAGWMEDLNLDPRNRSGGGMGTQVVQGERTQLLASAWQQVEGVIKANQLLKQAQLARATLQQIYNRRLQPAVSETLTVFTAPLHKKLMASPTTILFAVRQSLLPERLFSSVFRRVARPRRRLGMAPGALNQLISKVNSGQISIVPPLQRAPGGMVPIGQISSQAVPGWVRWLLDLLEKFPFLRIALPLLLVSIIVVIGLVAGWPAALGALAVSVAAAAALARTFQNARAASQLRPAQLTPQAVAQIPPRPDFQITAPGTALPTGAPGTTDSAQALAFRKATAELFTAIQAAPADPAPKPALNLEGLKTTLLARLDPNVTVPKRMQSLVNLSSRLPWKAPDPLEPIMAAPEFPQPMAVPLAALSQQYLLPGVDQIQPETLGLLEANHAFIEAYMVGLNHEMARQLLWNGYPTDQRGSYFRQFWDVSAYVPQPGDPTDPARLVELLKDIPPINTWPLPPGLGQHPNRTDIVPNNLVLLVRGELFKRYPNAVVYAGKARRLSDGTRVLDETDERYPIFRLPLTPDMTFLGFNLSAADAKGGTPASPEGFFFVFQEQPSEPRFGLEPSEDANPITRWAELSWTNFTAGSEGFQLPNLGKTKRAEIISNNRWRLASQAFRMTLAASPVPDFLSSTGQLHRIAIAAGNPADPDYSPDDPSNKWGVNSAQTAYVLLRLPFRILVHADLMLPS